MIGGLPLNANLTAERPTFVSYLECGLTGARYDADVLHGLSDAGRPLLVRYDLAGVGAALDKAALGARPRDLWRWRELLPVRRTENIVSLGEIDTPVIALDKVAAMDGGASGCLLVKDEGRLPTGSFKARGLALAVHDPVHQRPAVDGERHGTAYVQLAQRVGAVRPLGEGRSVPHH